MTTAFATLQGARIVAGSIAIPLYGLWSGDVQLATDQGVPSSVSLVIGNLTMQGAVYRQALFAGTRNVRIVGGAGGWRKNISFQQYRQASGVQASTVLGDAAKACGESVTLASSSVLGTYWTREAGPASRTLRAIAGDRWYVDTAGVTQVGARGTGKISSPFQVTNQNGGKGTVEISTEDYVSWVPGKTFTAPTMNGTFTVCGLIIHFSAEGKMRLEIATA